MNNNILSIIIISLILANIFIIISIIIVFAGNYGKNMIISQQ